MCVIVIIITTTIEEKWMEKGKMGVRNERGRREGIRRGRKKRKRHCFIVFRCYDDGNRMV